MTKKQQQNQTNVVFCHAFASNCRSFMACVHGHTHLIVSAHACGYYSTHNLREATNQGAASIRVNTVVANICC